MLANPNKRKFDYIDNIDLFFSNKKKFNNNSNYLFTLPKLNTKLINTTINNNLPLSPSSLQNSPTHLKKASSHSIFNQPELLDLIFSFVENDDTNNNPLKNCLYVSKLWYQVSKPIFQQNLTFTNSKQIDTFNRYYSHENNNTSLLKPKSLILKNINSSSSSLPIISTDQLSYLSFFNCPNLLPSKSWLNNLKNLKKLSLPNNQSIDDNLLIQLSINLPNLIHLDLRACHNISDSGVISIATHCPNISFINLNRQNSYKFINSNKKNSKIISSLSLLALSKCKNLKIIGISGNSICDVGLYEIINKLGKNLNILSINDCHLLTEKSINSLIIKSVHLPNLIRLEVCRTVKNEKQLNSLLNFKKIKNIDIKLSHSIERLH